MTLTDEKARADAADARAENLTALRLKQDEELVSLRGEVGRARALLRKIEWSANGGQNSYVCPACEHQREPHAPDCELAALIGKA